MAFNKKTVRDIDTKNKTVLVRASLNVPIEGDKVVDDLRLKAVIPTLQYLIDQGAKLVLVSHHSTEGQSLAPVAPVLSKLLSREVRFMPDCIGPATEAAVKAMQPGDVLMFENLRFHKEEEANDVDFAKQLAAMGELYVDDDFTTTHREHASIVGIPKLLPAVAGFQIEQEVDTITKAMENPKQPLLVIVGGAKVSTKIDFINNFLGKAQAMFIGGAMANTFLAANGVNIGKSIFEQSEIQNAKNIQQTAEGKKVSLLLPVDVVVTDNIKAASGVRSCDVGDVGPNEIIADLGPRSVEQVQSVLDQKSTVIWNGPLGITEKPVFAASSVDLAKRIIASGADSIVGGGDTAAFVDGQDLHDKFGFVSTGGGASLELMSGKKLPGIECLLDK